LEGVQSIRVIDLSDGCGSKFEIEIVAEEFIGKPLLAQHRYDDCNVRHVLNIRRYYYIYLFKIGSQSN